MSNHAPSSIRELKDAASQARVSHHKREALSFYHSLISLDPDDPYLHHQAGELAAQLGDPMQAIWHLHDAAIRYARTGFIARAIAVLKLAVQVGVVPDSVQKLLGELATIKGNRSALSTLAENAATRNGASSRAVNAATFVSPLDWMSETESPSLPFAPPRVIEVTLPHRAPAWHAQAARLMGIPLDAPTSRSASPRKPTALPAAAPPGGATARKLPKVGNGGVKRSPAGPRVGQVNPFRD